MVHWLGDGVASCGSEALRVGRPVFEDYFMSKIFIGNSEHHFCDVSESWIEHQVHERRRDGQPVCARVVLKAHSVDMVLATPNCAPGSGGGRQPNGKELDILRIWEKERLNDPLWTVGNLIAFVKRARSLIC
jgi:hypothetical protein